MFKIMKSGFYCTNLEQINSRKLLNLFFKHISSINGPRQQQTKFLIVLQCSFWEFDKDSGALRSFRREAASILRV